MKRRRAYEKPSEKKARDAGELLYRIKTISEPFERVAKESELRLAPVA